MDTTAGAPVLCGVVMRFASIILVIAGIWIVVLGVLCGTLNQDNDELRAQLKDCQTIQEAAATVPDQQLGRIEVLLETSNTRLEILNTKLSCGDIARALEVKDNKR
jgi:hypothetical protein